MPLYNSSDIQVSVTPPSSNFVDRRTVPVPGVVNTATVIAPVNAGRRGMTLANNSTGNVLIELGAAPTVDTYTVRLEPKSYYELPYGFTGQIQGMWDALGGVGVLVRELSLI